MPKAKNSGRWQWISSQVYRAPWEKVSQNPSWEIRQWMDGDYVMAKRVAGGLDVKLLESPEDQKWAAEMRRSEPRQPGVRRANIGRPRTGGGDPKVALSVRVSPASRNLADELANELGLSLGEVVERGLGSLRREK